MSTVEGRVGTKRGGLCMSARNVEISSALACDVERKGGWLSRAMEGAQAGGAGFRGSEYAVVRGVGVGARTSQGRDVATDSGTRS